VGSCLKNTPSAGVGRNSLTTLKENACMTCISHGAESKAPWLESQQGVEDTHGPNDEKETT
jgi:hypothetical protein